MDLISFAWSVFASGTANKLYDLFNKDDIEKLENFYTNRKKEEFEEYIQILIEENNKLKDKLSENKIVFDNLKTKVDGKDSTVNIDIETKEKNLSLGNDSDIEVKNGGNFKLNYKG